MGIYSIAIIRFPMTMVQHGHVCHLCVCFMSFASEDFPALWSLLGSFQKVADGQRWLLSVQRNPGLSMESSWQRALKK